jgi:hypothetical protein
MSGCKPRQELTAHSTRVRKTFFDIFGDGVLPFIDAVVNDSDFDPALW